MSATGYLVVALARAGLWVAAGVIVPRRSARSPGGGAARHRQREASPVRFRLRGLALVLGAGGVVASLGLPLEARGAAPNDPAPELGRAAPDFTLPDLAGKPVRLAELRGKTAVLINFWATWCPPCREEMPTLERLSRSRGG